MREPPDTCEASEVFDVQEHPFLTASSKSYYSESFDKESDPSMRSWCGLSALRYLCGTIRSIASRPVAYCTINTIQTPLQKTVARKSALIIYPMKQRDLSANAYFSYVI